MTIPPGRQLSVCLSDGVLSLMSFYASKQLENVNAFASYGLLTIGIASLTGVLRCSMSNAHDAIVYIHTTASWLASVMGISLIVCGAFEMYNLVEIGYIFLGSSTVITVGSLVKAIDYPEIGDIIPIICMSSVLVLYIAVKNMYGMIAIAMYIVAFIALLTGDKRWMGVKSVDWFHYIAAVGNIAFLEAFRTK